MDVEADVSSSSSGPRFVEAAFIEAAHTKAVAAVKISPDGSVIASASADKTAKLWALSGGKPLGVLEGHTQGLSDVAWSPDGTTLATASDDSTVRVWDVAAGREGCAPLRGHTNYVFCLAFCPRTNVLVSGSFDESVRLWDLRTGRCFRTLAAHSEPVTSVAFSPDGELLATGSYDGLVRFWDSGSGQCLKTMHEEGVPPVTGVRFSPNGRFLLAASLDARLRLWDPVSGKRVKTYGGHLNHKYAAQAAFAVGARGQPLVAAGGEDGRMCMWHVGSRALAQELRAHRGLVLALDTHLGSGALVTAGAGDPPPGATNALGAGAGAAGSSVVASADALGAVAAGGASLGAAASVSGDFSIRVWVDAETDRVGAGADPAAVASGGAGSAPE